MSLKWVLQRYYRIGNIMSWLERALEPELRRSPAAMLVEGTELLSKNLVLLLPALFEGRGPAVRQLRFLVMGAGMILGVLGHRYVEYRSVQGG